MNEAYNKAEFYGKAMFGMLHKSEMEHTRAAEFTLFKRLKNFQSTKNTIWKIVCIPETLISKLSLDVSRPA